MFDHITLTVSNLKRSLSFYKAALAPLGVHVESEYDGGAGLGLKGKPQLWLQEGAAPARTHVAFVAPSRKAVELFHAAAIANGGKDNGAPELRESYSPTYFAAFVHDPDGNNLEAVIHSA